MTDYSNETEALTQLYFLSLENCWGIQSEISKLMKIILIDFIPEAKTKQKNNKKLNSS